MSNKSKIKKPAQPLRLDLGCGQNCQPGFTGVDLYAPGVDVRCNLFDFPFRPARICANDGTISSTGAPLWKDNSVDEIFCSHFLEHVPRVIRWHFMEECWRILKPDAVMRIIVPSWKSERAYGDMTHEPPAVVPMFFFYLNRGWREANKLTYGDYALKCNFEHQAGPTQIAPEFAQRSVEVQQFACAHYLESYGDMWVTLTRKL